jgi:hypothetical protein
MITIFTIPKPFVGEAEVIQKNAIKSWLKLNPKPEIFLMGDDFGVKETAEELCVVCMDAIKKNEFGTPLLSSAFNEAKANAKNNILVYINCDIILQQDFIEAVKKFNENNLSQFLMSGRRIDVEPKDVPFFKERGVMHGFSGMDYFVFPKNFCITLPDFAVGVSGWDTWLAYETRRLKIPFVDATSLVTAIHQNHLPRGKKKPSYEKEKEINFKLAQGLMNMMTLREADKVLTENGLSKPDFPRSIFAKLALFYPWRFFLLIKRTILSKE